MQRTMLENATQEERLLGSQKLRWEDRVKEDVEKVMARRVLEEIIVGKGDEEASMLGGMVLKVKNHEEE